jgi:hypothetical protein
VNANSVKQVYKFKPRFKKIGQTKALNLSYVFPQIFTLLLSYLNGEGEKQTTSFSGGRSWSTWREPLSQVHPFL